MEDSETARSEWRSMELNSLLGMEELLTASDLRRIAELTWFLGVEVSIPWWRKAAAAGDEDAMDVLEQFREEGLI